jgi:hypothetical protein
VAPSLKGRVGWGSQQEGGTLLEMFQRPLASDLR